MPKMPDILLVKNAIHLAQHYALENQYPEGYWRGSDETNNAMEAEFIFINYFLGTNDALQTQKLVKQILDCQLDDGTWGVYYGSPGELSITTECYFALKLAGVNVDLPNMKKARDFILAHGGIEKTRIFTKFWLALFGQYAWHSIPVLPPELIYLPSWFPINIYEFASWARSGIVPLMIILTEKPVCRIPVTAQISELYVNSNATSSNHPALPFFSLQRFFIFADKCLRLYEKSPWKPGRNKAKKKVLDWMMERVQADGTTGGTEAGWSFTMLAFKTAGYSSDHPVIKNCLDGVLKNYSYEDAGALRIEATNSPIWDTCLMLTALIDSGLAINSPALAKGVEFLLRNQIKSKGDWQVKVPNVEPAGWAFEFANNYYPDIDDTAEVLIALSRYQNNSTSPNDNLHQAIQQGTRWMLALQSENGGWAAFDKDNTRTLLTKLPFFDFGEIIDPPSVDVTAHVLEALGVLGFSLDHPQIKRGLDYIFSEQEADGSWFGRWGVNYIYGTSAVIVALRALNVTMSELPIARGIDWILSKQNPDGGWGESCASYVNLDESGVGPSTASQTAWALMALIAANRIDDAATQNGMAYLCKTLPDTGIWDEPYYTGCGFGGYLTGMRPTRDVVKNLGKELSTGFMLRYDLYRHYWPLRALGMYKEAMKAKIVNSA